MPDVLRGALTIHGGDPKRRGCPDDLEIRDTEARLRTDFPLNLKDYHIGGLSKMLGMLKMHEDIEVHVDLLFQLGAGKLRPASGWKRVARIRPGLRAGPSARRGRRPPLVRPLPHDSNSSQARRPHRFELLPRANRRVAFDRPKVSPSGEKVN